MFVGHYGLSFAVKALDKSIPLWVLFIAVQFVDTLWSILVLLGIEKVRILPGRTDTNPLDFYYKPYSHSLVSSIVLSGIVAVGYRLLPKLGIWAKGGLAASAVFSHWVLDLLVHGRDIPLYGDAAKVGFGLWNFPIVAFLLETAFLLGGMVLYLKATKPVAAGGRYAMVIFGFIMLAVQSSAFFGPPPPSGKEIAGMELGSYLIFGGVAYWLERKRI